MIHFRYSRFLVNALLLGHLVTGTDIPQRPLSRSVRHLPRTALRGKWLLARSADPLVGRRPCPGPTGGTGGGGSAGRGALSRFLLSLSSLQVLGRD